MGWIAAGSHPRSRRPRCPMDSQPQAAPPSVVNFAALRRERLARLRAEILRADCGAAVFLDPINIRYATDVSNMQVWGLHNPVRYSYVAAEGPVLHFEFPSCRHLAQGIETIDEVRDAQAATYLMAGPELAGARPGLGRRARRSATTARRRQPAPGGRPLGLGRLSGAPAPGDRGRRRPGGRRAGPAPQDAARAGRDPRVGRRL